MRELPMLFSGPLIRSILNGRKIQSRRPVTKATSDVAPCIYDGCNWDRAWVDPGLGGGQYLKAKVTDESLGMCGTVQRIRCRVSIGDMLYVRETWRIGAWSVRTQEVAIDYQADGYCRREWLKVPSSLVFARYLFQCDEDCQRSGLEPDDRGRYQWKPGEAPTRWRTSIHMPRWASRITLEVTDVRVQRAHEITASDVRSEGIEERVIEDWRKWVHRNDAPGSAFAELWEGIYTKPGQRWEDNPWVWVYEFKVCDD